MGAGARLPAAGTSRPAWARPDARQIQKNPARSLARAQLLIFNFVSNLICNIASSAGDQPNVPRPRPDEHRRQQWGAHSVGP